eukprot:SAG22_NODE_160_length_16938_cov_3.491241_6_plen_614_part_00
MRRLYNESPVRSLSSPARSTSGSAAASTPRRRHHAHVPRPLPGTPEAEAWADAHAHSRQILLGSKRAKKKRAVRREPGNFKRGAGATTSAPPPPGAGHDLLAPASSLPYGLEEDAPSPADMRVDRLEKLLLESMAGGSRPPSPAASPYEPSGPHSPAEREAKMHADRSSMEAAREAAAAAAKEAAEAQERSLVMQQQMQQMQAQLAREVSKNQGQLAEVKKMKERQANERAAAAAAAAGPPAAAVAPAAGAEAAAGHFADVDGQLAGLAARLAEQAGNVRRLELAIADEQTTKRLFVTTAHLVDVEARLRSEFKSFAHQLSTTSDLRQLAMAVEKPLVPATSSAPVPRGDSADIAQLRQLSSSLTAEMAHLRELVAAQNSDAVTTELKAELAALQQQQISHNAETEARLAALLAAGPPSAGLAAASTTVDTGISSSLTAEMTQLRELVAAQNSDALTTELKVELAALQQQQLSHNAEMEARLAALLAAGPPSAGLAAASTTVDARLQFLEESDALRDASIREVMAEVTGLSDMRQTQLAGAPSTSSVATAPGGSTGSKTEPGVLSALDAAALKAEMEAMMRQELLRHREEIDVRMAEVVAPMTNPAGGGRGQE